MPRTALHDKLAAAGARLGEYAGAETALVITDARSEYAALQKACGVFDLGWQARIIVSGKDRTRWLNGMVSNNIRDLSSGRGVYSFLLNPQGRILGDMYVHNRGDNFVISTERSQAENLVAALKRYIIMDKVELEDISEQLTAIGVLGPKSPEVLARAGLAVGALDPLQIQDAIWRGVGISLTRMAGDHVSYEIWASAENVGVLWDGLLGAGALPVGTEALELFRIAAGIPRYGLDIRQSELPQETGQMQALNFSKGCYIGQEIVERIRSRGSVHRQFTGFIIEGPTPAPGTKVSGNGKEVGEITSAAAVPSRDGDKLLALGYIRREAAQPGAIVQAGEARARVVNISDLRFLISD